MLFWICLDYTIKRSGMGYNLPAPSGLNVWELEGVTAEGVVAEDAGSRRRGC